MSQRIEPSCCTCISLCNKWRTPFPLLSCQEGIGMMPEVVLNPVHDAVSPCQGALDPKLQSTGFEPGSVVRQVKPGRWLLRNVFLDLTYLSSHATVIESLVHDQRLSECCLGGFCWVGSSSLFNCHADTWESSKILPDLWFQGVGFNQSVVTHKGPSL